MTENNKSITSAISVLAATVSLLCGNVWRSHVEKGPGESSSFTMNSLLASKNTDIDLNEVDFFHEMSKLLKREYVDPITDDQKLASGAVRGMIGSLGDPQSLYFDKDEFRVFNENREGKYEGIGVELGLQLDTPSGPNNRAGILPNPGEDDGPSSPDRAIRVPDLVAMAVVPGGPADKAGVKVGDRVSYVDGQFLIDKESIQQFRDSQMKFREVQDKFSAGKMAADGYKMEVERYRALHKEFRLKLENSILPLRAKDRLTSGLEESLTVVWKRGKSTRETRISKAKSSEPTFSAQGNQISALSFNAGASVRLSEAIAEKPIVTIDLRNNVNGDFQEMRKCLAVLAPTGQYGYVVSDRERKPQPISVSVGNAKSPKVTLIVDGSTGGAAAIFARALKEKKHAVLSGTPSADINVVEIFGLPDGTGYSLVSGRYSASTPSAKRASKSKGGTA